MKIRVKESGNIYDVDAVFVKGGDLILPLGDVEILLDEQPATLEETESYDYEALRNELAAKLYTIIIKNVEAEAASKGAIEDANEFIRQLKKSPVK